MLILGLKGMSTYVKPFSDSYKPEGNFHVMTYNVMVGWKMLDKNNKPSESRYEAFKSLIEEEPMPGVICTQESSKRADEILKDSLGYSFVHKIEKRSPSIFSKYPIVSNGQISFGSSLNSCLWADIKIENDTLRIYSVHLESNRLSNSSYDFLVQDEYETSKAVKGIMSFLLKYPVFAGKRADQAILVREHIESSPYPVVVSGDFNDPPMSYTYRTLKSELNDTFLDNGRGFGTTWTGAIPLLRIDYIFASKEINNTAFICMDSDLSDHYPIKASFQLE